VAGIPPLPAAGRPERSARIPTLDIADRHEASNIGEDPGEVPEMTLK
jgi:hypothetical protein